MKIYIITRHAIINYGSLFQSYATESFFRQIGYETRTIDYIPKSEYGVKRIVTFADFAQLHGVKRLVYELIKIPDEMIKGLVFGKFRKRMLALTERFYTLEQLQSHDFGNSILCAGSDQLWGYMPTGRIDKAYFLDFGTERNKRIAYASSFGRTDFDNDFYAELRPLLLPFNLITVREESAVSLIQEHTALPSVPILDPTLMLSREFWLNLAHSKVRKSNYIILYQLRKNIAMDEYVADIARINGWKVVRVSTSIYDKLGFGRCRYLVPPEKILSLFRDAAYIVTDSFHATVFSLIFHKQFLDVLPSTTYERITDLLGKLGLMDRVTDCSNAKSDLTKSTIDYDRVDKILTQERLRATNIIEKAIKEIQ